MSIETGYKKTPQYIRMAQAVEELYYWQHGTNPTNFTSLLYTLISKADLMNSTRLVMAFPDECAAFSMWQESEDQQSFFREWMSE